MIQRHIVNVITNVVSSNIVRIALCDNTSLILINDKTGRDMLHNDSHMQFTVSTCNAIL